LIAAEARRDITSILTVIIITIIIIVTTILAFQLQARAVKMD
jgi:hypothetical protein